MGDLSRRYLEQTWENERQHEESVATQARRTRRSIRKMAYMIICCSGLAILIATPLLMRAFADEGMHEAQRVTLVAGTIQDDGAESTVTATDLAEADAIATTTVTFKGDSETLFQWDGNGDGIFETYRVLKVCDRILDADEIAKAGVTDDAFCRAGDARGFAIEEILPEGAGRAPAYLFVQGGHDPALHVSMSADSPHIDIDYRMYGYEGEMPPLRVRLVNGTLMMTEQTII